MSSNKNRSTRDVILKSAWKALEEAPDKSVRMSDIAKRAGVSRQALYLHFPTRGDLLTATSRYLDVVLDVDARLIPSRTAANGLDRLNAFIAFWTSYIPEIYGVAKALMVMKDHDDAAATAWADRMGAVHEGCVAATQALSNDGVLADDLSVEKAADLLWVLLSVRHWEDATKSCGWSQEDYVYHISRAARLSLLKPA